MLKQLDDCMLFKARVLEHKLNKIAEVHFAEFEMHMTYAYILKVVYFEKEIHPKELAEILYALPSTITRMVNKLEKEGLLEQGNETSKKIIYLSPSGKKMMPRLLEVWDEYHKAIEVEFGNENMQQLSVLLSDVIR